MKSEKMRKRTWQREGGSKWARLTERTSRAFGEKYTQRERERGYGNKGWKGTWQRRGADRDNMWQWNREIMADRFNEVFPDVILSCNYSALLSARVYTHVCAALNIPADVVWSRQRPLAQRSLHQHMTKTCSQEDSYPAGAKKCWTRVENPNLPGNHS